jgi:hypothetical protein
MGHHILFNPKEYIKKQNMSPLRPKKKMSFLEDVEGYPLSDKYFPDTIRNCK